MTEILHKIEFLSLLEALNNKVTFLSDPMEFPSEILKNLRRRALPRKGDSTLKVSEITVRYNKRECNDSIMSIKKV